MYSSIRRQKGIGQPMGLCAAIVMAISTPSMVAAQGARPIPSGAASPPALTRLQAEAQPGYASSLEHFQALKRKARPPVKVLPDWGGLWLNAEPLQFDPGYRFNVMTSAPLKPEPAARYAKVVSDAAKGIQWDSLSDCLPAGYPRLLAEQHPYELIVTSREVWIVSELMNEAHRIYTDGRGHYPDDEAYPLWEGDSIGFWDGDTLIAHTTNLKANPNGYQRSGPPQSDQASTIEQWRMIDADHIVLQMTIYDPVNLIHPWRPAPRTFVRLKQPAGLRVEYYACGESSAVTRDEKGVTHMILPGEPGYIDPNTILERGARR